MPFRFAILLAGEFERPVSVHFGLVELLSGLGHDFGRSVPTVHFSFDDDDTVLRPQCLGLGRDTGEYEDFDPSREIFDTDKIHRLTVFGKDFLGRGNHTAEADRRAVREFFYRGDRCRDLFQIVIIVRDRMVGDVESDQLLLPCETLLLRRGARRRDEADGRLVEREPAEEAVLMRVFDLVDVFGEREDGVDIGKEHIPFPESVECADLGECFE